MTRYEAYVEKNWQELGLAHLLVARIRDDGSADFAVFLVDLLCLGVKDVFNESGVTEADVRELLEERLPEDFREPIHPACAKKMIEGAIAYAQSLGFAPHRDYRKARKVLSGLDAALCPTEFAYGENGKPCYVRGSEDDDDRVNRILARLEARCGPDGFTYVDPGEEEEDDIAELRMDLMGWLEAEPDSVPQFHEFSGMITALLLCPEPVGPLEIQDLLWGGTDGRTWKDQAEVQEFLDRLKAYWNHVNDLILACLPPDSPKNFHPIDIEADDFDADDNASLLTAFLEWAAGFMRAVDAKPDLWRAARTRPDLAPHWATLSQWAQARTQDEFSALLEAGKKEYLPGAVVALARALRRP